MKYIANYLFNATHISPTCPYIIRQIKRLNLITSSSFALNFKIDYFLVRLKEHPSSHQPCSCLETINEIPFSHSILNSFWTARSQMIDNAVLHHIMKRNVGFFYGNREILSKKEFMSRNLLKTPD